MAVVNQTLNFGRIAVYGNVAVIKVTFTVTAVTYTSASGGLPIDLTTILTQAAPFSQPYLNPADVVDVYAVGLTTNGFLPGTLANITPVYVAATYPFAGGSLTNIHPDNQLSTCTATLKLYGIGAAVTNHAAFGEVADGAVTDTITLHIVVARGGTNIN